MIMRDVLNENFIKFKDNIQLLVVMKTIPMRRSIDSLMV